MLTAANSRDFKPIPLGIHIRGNIPTEIRQIQSNNVIAKVEGSDPQLKSEAVIFTAHWDHLGIGPAVDGDSIYNGAVDNATGCAMIIEMARAWAALEHKPKRSAIFMAVTAEEAGLRGTEYYAAHPVIPLAKTALDLNFDAFYPFGRTKDVSVTGAERTTVWPRTAWNSPSNPTRNPSKGTSTAPTISRSRTRAYRPFQSIWAPNIMANRPATATRFSKSTTTSIIINRPTSITTIGISRGWRRPRASAS
jgi:hypothetical protein